MNSRVEITTAESEDYRKQGRVVGFEDGDPKVELDSGKVTVHFMRHVKLASEATEDFPERMKIICESILKGSLAWLQSHTVQRITTRVK